MSLNTIFAQDFAHACDEDVGSSNGCCAEYRHFVAATVVEFYVVDQQEGRLTLFGEYIPKRSTQIALIKMINEHNKDVF